jgi:hypothetical protein
MKSVVGSILLVLFISLFTSCSTVQKIAIGQTGEIVYKASFDQQIENDWQMFSTTLPSNLKLLESFLSQDPQNKNLLASMIKGYAAKGFGIDETRYLKDKFEDKDESIHRERALLSYTRALELGTVYFKASGLDSSLLTNNISTPDKLKKYLNKKLSDDVRDVEVVAYIGQALGGLINLQKSNMRVVAYVPVMKSLFDWSCEKNSKLAYGLCDLFYATYDASRPKMLGGDPLKGKRKFLAAIKKWPSNFLTRVTYIEQYAIPMLDDSEYRVQKLALSPLIQDFNKNKIWTGQALSAPTKKYTNVYNMIAAKRMSIIEKYEGDIF